MPSADASPSTGAVLGNISPGTLIRVSLILFVWYTCCAVSDTIGAELVRTATPVVTTFLLMSVGSVSGIVLCKIFLPKATTGPIDMILTARNPKKSAVFGLLLIVSISNCLALYMMFEGFSSGGMSGAYALKATEPLLTCVLAVPVCFATLAVITAATSKAMLSIHQRLGTLPAGSTIEEEQTLAMADVVWKNVPPSAKIWLSITILVLGAIVVSKAVRNTSNATLTLTAVAMILTSNFLFAFRTTVQKVLLQQYPTTDSTEVIAFLFINVGLLSSALLFPFAVVSWHNHPPAFSIEDWRSVFIGGVCYYIYQMCNNVVLSYVTPVSYAIAKQIRVLSIFLFSIAYFRREIRGELVFCGMAMVLVGTYTYAKEQVALDAKMKAANSPETCSEADDGVVTAGPRASTPVTTTPTVRAVFNNSTNPV